MAARVDIEDEISVAALMGRTGSRRRRRAGRALVALLGTGTVLASCASGGGDASALPRSTGRSAVTAVVGPGAEQGSVDEPTIRVDLAATGRSFDRRVLGTNAPAWLGPERLADPAFRQTVTALGTPVIRMPGGTWSNSYDWLACETRDATACFWPWAARPSDFAAFLAAIGAPGMWTVSINGTAEEAAALVAFFNGSSDDDRAIGVDRRGRDWGTVGEWARLRAAGGQRDPVRVEMWEVGNEVFAARPAAGPECASFGWEDVWTCDGDEYVRGDEDHDGFLAFRDAMLAVDPTIAVGAVGIAGPQDGWGGFGQEVLEAAAGQMDFYSVHHYGFDRGEPSLEEVLTEPESWEELLAGIRDGAARSGASLPPVAVTEYNMFALQDGDTAGLMAAPTSALYTALVIGALVDGGVTIANHWNLVNGRTEHGSDYGIVDAEDGSLLPQFHALAAWSRMRSELVPVDLSDDAIEALDVHASTDGAGAMTMIVVNRSTTAVQASLVIDGIADGTVLATSEVVVDPADRSAGGLLVDGRPATGSLDDLALSRAEALAPTSASTTRCTFEPLSITVLSTP